MTTATDRDDCFRAQYNNDAFGACATSRPRDWFLRVKNFFLTICVVSHRHDRQGGVVLVVRCGDHQGASARRDRARGRVRG